MRFLFKRLGSSVWSLGSGIRRGGNGLPLGSTSSLGGSTQSRNNSTAPLGGNTQTNSTSTASLGGSTQTSNTSVAPLGGNTPGNSNIGYLGGMTEAIYGSGNGSKNPTKASHASFAFSNDIPTVLLLVSLFASQAVLSGILRISS